jgi:hypothetical protein
MFSSIANYLNSLVVLAKFYFVDNPLADVSFTSDRVDTEFVLAGLRRVRAQTNAKAKSEAVQKPLHAQWLSWPECQQVRRACQAAFLAKGDKDKAGGDERQHKKSNRLLKSLVCLMFYTIAPPPRCSIVRLLQWRTTLVKKRSDPSRYVIDLLNNPDAPASQHKVCVFLLLVPLLGLELPAPLGPSGVCPRARRSLGWWSNTFASCSFFLLDRAPRGRPFQIVYFVLFLSVLLSALVLVCVDVRGTHPFSCPRLVQWETL